MQTFSLTPDTFQQQTLPKLRGEIEMIAREKREERREREHETKEGVTNESQNEKGK